MFSCVSHLCSRFCGLASWAFLAVLSPGDSLRRRKSAQFCRHPTSAQMLLSYMGLPVWLAIHHCAACQPAQNSRLVNCFHSTFGVFAHLFFLCSIEVFCHIGDDYKLLSKVCLQTFVSNALIIRFSPFV